MRHTGRVVTQDFNTLPTTWSFTASAPGPLELSAAPISASGMIGWSIAPTNAPATTLAEHRADPGSSNVGSHLSSGTVAGADGALGVIASGNYVGKSMGTLVNHSGSLLTEITVGFKGEQWRQGGGSNLTTLSAAPQHHRLHRRPAMVIGSGDLDPSSRRHGAQSAKRDDGCEAPDPGCHGEHSRLHAAESPTVG